MTMQGDLVHPTEPPTLVRHHSQIWSMLPSRRLSFKTSILTPVVPGRQQPALPHSSRHSRSSSFPRRVHHSSSSSLSSSPSFSSTDTPAPPAASSTGHSVHFTVQSRFGRPLELEMMPWFSIKDVKHAIECEHGLPAGRMRLFYRGREWGNARTLHDINMNDGDVMVAVVGGGSADGSSGKVSIAPHGAFVDLVKDSALVRQCRQGLLCGLAPQLTLEGSGGTYRMRNARKLTVGMFKPCDEEPFAPNNPRGHVGGLGQAGFRRGVRSGEAASREIAASLLDHGGFSGVPFTTKVEVFHPAFHQAAAVLSKSTSKVGSLQEFVRHDELAADLAPQSFPVREVHKIGVLDLRLLNVDRNDCNILVCRSPFRLVPIDHGYSLPRLLEVGWCDWVWLGWPQAHAPFDSETLAYIAAIDVDADLQLLRSRLGINEVSLRNARISTMLLQTGASAGLTLFDIGSMASRGELEQPSMLEVATAQAEALALKAPALCRSISDGVLPTQMHSFAALNEAVACCCDRDASECACEPAPAQMPLDLDAFWMYLDMLINQLVENRAAAAQDTGGQ